MDLSVGADHGDQYAKALNARHQNRVTEVEVSDSIFADVDAPQDLMRANA
jgi:CTP:molybdopterin cytidylyltransferase MocA